MLSRLPSTAMTKKQRLVRGSPPGSLAEWGVHTVHGGTARWPVVRSQVTLVAADLTSIRLWLVWLTLRHTMSNTSNILFIKHVVTPRRGSCYLCRPVPAPVFLNTSPDADRTRTLLTARLMRSAAVTANSVVCVAAGLPAPIIWTPEGFAPRRVTSAPTSLPPTLTTHPSNTFVRPKAHWGSPPVTFLFGISTPARCVGHTSHHAGRPLGLAPVRSRWPLTLRRRGVRSGPRSHGFSRLPLAARSLL